MLKDVLRHADLVLWAEMGLVVFFLIFVLCVLWAATRRRADLSQWAALPLEDQAYVKEMRHE
jgi:cbb3-type cytochrome oxidase subunit 3